MAANNCKQASIGRYTHERNALSLVWGSLRLGPITMQPIYQSNPQDQMFKIICSAKPLPEMPSSKRRD